MAIDLETLNDWIGKDVLELRDNIQDDGWKYISSFNDYKWVWGNDALNISIGCKIDVVEADNENGCSEIINRIWTMDGIYDETPTPESTKQAGIMLSQVLKQMDEFSDEHKKEAKPIECKNCGNKYTLSMTCDKCGHDDLLGDFYLKNPIKL